VVLDLMKSYEPYAHDNITTTGGGDANEGDNRDGSGGRTYEALSKLLSILVKSMNSSSSNNTTNQATATTSTISTMKNGHHSTIKTTSHDSSSICIGRVEQDWWATI